MLGGLGALVVLAFVFASFLALVPLVMAAISILTTFLAVGGLTHITAISQIVEFLIALIGLGVAIDYSLLIVTRWREERDRGADNHAAVTAAMTSAGRAVLLSGLTVGVGLLALVVLPVPFLRSAGIGGVLIPLISVAVALTLLPVLLTSIGPRLDWPRLRTESTASRGWTAWARFTARHRSLAALAGTATLAVLIVPAFSMHVGEPNTRALAQTGPAHTALATLQAGGVPSGALTPIDVLTRAARAGPSRISSPRWPACTPPWPRPARTLAGAERRWSPCCPPPRPTSQPGRTPSGPFAPPSRTLPGCSASPGRGHPRSTSPTTSTAASR